MTFKDHFSKQSKTYSEARPHYPEQLFEYLSGLTSSHECAWDCATGSGQAALALVEYYDKVIATDASESQLKYARQNPAIDYRCVTAEDSLIEPASVDLVVVAQAVHWFRFQPFYQEVKRVLKPEGVLALWGYGLHSISPQIDEVILHLYTEIVGSYWPPERRHVEAKYENILFPFELLDPPEFEMQLIWSLSQLTDYLNSWSSVVRFKRDKGKDPLVMIQQELVEAWGGEQQRTVSWPLFLKTGYVQS